MNVNLKCCYCNKDIVIEIPEKRKDLITYNIFSCNNCIPEYSRARNGIDEVPYTEI